MTSIEKLANSFRQWETEWKQYEEGKLAIKPKSFNEFIAPFIEMHKQEIIKSNRDGVDMIVDKKPFIIGEQYYQETFVSKGSDEVESFKQDMDKLDYNLEMTPSEQLKRIADKLKNKVGNDGFMFDAGSTYPPDVDKLGNEDVPKLGYDVDKLAEDTHEWLNNGYMDRKSLPTRQELKDWFTMKLEAKETLYTEEQIFEKQIISIIDEVSPNWYKCYTQEDKKAHLSKIISKLK